MINAHLIEQISDSGSCDFANKTTSIDGIGYMIREDGTLQRAGLLDTEHYSESFGLEWEEFSHVLADSYLGIPKSLFRLQGMMASSVEILANKTVLEIGPGGGRFTEILVENAKAVICLEPSSAARINMANPKPNLVILQEDLENNPVDVDKIDVVICRGVIQHTPRPLETIAQLFRNVREGGLLFFDFYARRPLYPKYWLRHITRRLPEKLLLGIVKTTVPSLSRIKWQLDALGLPLWFTQRLIPIIDMKGTTGFETSEQAFKANTLDTFDAYSPRYDNPPRQQDVLKYLVQEGHEFISPPDLKNNFFRMRKRPSNQQ